MTGVAAGCCQTGEALPFVCGPSVDGGGAGTEAGFLHGPALDSDALPCGGRMITSLRPGTVVRAVVGPPGCCSCCCSCSGASSFKPALSPLGMVPLLAGADSQRAPGEAPGSHEPVARPAAAGPFTAAEQRGPWADEPAVASVTPTASLS